MTAFRGTLPPAARDRYDAAVKAAGAASRAAWDDLHEYASVHGTRAAAERARYPGHPLSVEEIQQRIEQARGQGRRKAA